MSSTWVTQAAKKVTASIRSASPSGTGTPLGDMDEELSGPRPPQYRVATPDPTIAYNEFNEPAEFSKMISQANNPDVPTTADPAQSSFAEPWEPTQPATSNISHTATFNPDAREEHIGAAEAARSSNLEAQDAYMSSLHRIQGSLLEAEAPRKEALDRATSLEKHCIGVEMSCQKLAARSCRNTVSITGFFWQCQ
ncbi:hypothetical protein RhiJN_27698 [Ceratobasidium sp. AG-Ba]|nr:hypothetical protein RhiJN_27698 [Ceratobasidium sp. AG-Ba]